MNEDKEKIEWMAERLGIEPILLSGFLEAIEEVGFAKERDVDFLKNHGIDIVPVIARQKGIKEEAVRFRVHGEGLKFSEVVAALLELCHVEIVTRAFIGFFTVIDFQKKVMIPFEYNFYTKNKQFLNRKTIKEMAAKHAKARPEHITVTNIIEISLSDMRDYMA